ncbi:MAG: DUF1223 domain-containing protein [Acetobacteraceae bacterium]
MQRRTLLAAASAAMLARAVPSRAATSPVVLELFTSQGCSSCPPADALLGDLSHRPGVIALAWHVDYWDRLGWRDPYSSHLATERQRAYATLLGAEVYTPALVVDGAHMVVGSARPAVSAAIASAAPASVTVELRPAADGLVLAVGRTAGPVSALLVSFDPEHETPIGGGENGGRRLREFNTVRRAVMLASWDGAPRTLRTETPTPDMGTVVLVQDATLRVLGAAILPPLGKQAA